MVKLYIVSRTSHMRIVVGLSDPRYVCGIHLLGLSLVWVSQTSIQQWGGGQPQRVLRT